MWMQSSSLPLEGNMMLYSAESRLNILGDEELLDKEVDGGSYLSAGTFSTPITGTENHPLDMAYRHSGPPIRDVYEEQFRHDPRDVPHHRMVNIGQKRNSFPRPGHDYDVGYDNELWCGGPRHYQHIRDYHNEDLYQHIDRRYFDGNSSFGNYPRNSPPHRNEVLYPQKLYSRDDLRHQLSARKSNRSHHFRGRGRGSGPRPARSKKVEDRDYRTTTSSGVKRDRSPVEKEGSTPSTARSGSNTSSKNVCEETEKGQTSQETQQKNKPSVVVRQTPSSSVEDSPCSSGSLKEQPSASVVESEKKEEEEKEEEVEEVTTSMEPKLTPEEDFKARRSEAIKTKAAEIEKHFRQDCETFHTVVMMLVAKDPRLENLLQTSLDENLLEIKQHCLDALRSFVTELDQLAEQADASA